MKGNNRINKMCIINSGMLPESPRSKSKIKTQLTFKTLRLTITPRLLLTILSQQSASKKVSCTNIIILNIYIVLGDVLGFQRKDEM